MTRIAYVPKKFRADTLKWIGSAQRIVKEYQEAGHTLTVRQLYYQFVARGLIANNMKMYNKLKDVVTDARLAGYLDWEAIEDRTRNLSTRPSWDSPQDIVEAVSRQFHMDMWETQPRRVEVWVEKEALSGVFEKVCKKWDVPFFACRGYPSWSEVWRHGMRFQEHYDATEQPTLILHFGDHDPSGMDMTADLKRRIYDTLGVPMEVQRIALNMDQVHQYKPPPNPAKFTDSRARAYVAEFGKSSWELDALDPATLVQLVEDHVRANIEWDAWEERELGIKEGKADLAAANRNWAKVVDLVREE